MKSEAVIELADYQSEIFSIFTLSLKKIKKPPKVVLLLNQKNHLSHPN